MQHANFLLRSDLQQMLDIISGDGFRVLGPRLRDGAIFYEDLRAVDELPGGWGDVQSPGRYRLEHQDSPRYFAWANGPQALKPHLFRPRESLWRVNREEGGALAFSEPAMPDAPLAVIGMRACDLAALELQDRHFLGSIPDPYYAARREGLLIVAVHCTHPADTCFCASTGDGPRAERGFDLALSELDEGYLVEVGSERGERIARRLPLQASSEAQRQQAAAEIDGAAARQTRRLPEGNLRDTLFARLDHARWNEVAARCLSCGNCTSVCPTCFCHAEQDVPALDATSSEHVRQWDSCFTEGHSYIHGIVIRAETGQRYRQWMTHKLGSWHDQYGRSGCVGCGRCLTWCPVGIDLTEEAQAICAPARDKVDDKAEDKTGDAIEEGKV
jgi:ferredoxin